MEIDAFPSRSLTGIITRAITGSARNAPGRRGPYAPPSCRSAGLPSVDLQSDEVTLLCRDLLSQLLVGRDHVVDVFDDLDPDAVLWTPSCFVSTRLAVVEILLAQEPVLSPLSDLSITIWSTDVVSPRVILEWQVAGRFTRPFFVADDRLLEPTGHLVETAGAFIVTFGAAGVAAMHLYHDPLAVLEQMLTT